MTHYELATLSVKLGSLPAAIAGIEAWTKDGAAKGTLLGCWQTEIGQLNRLIVLRGFDAPEDLTAERRRALDSTSPFGAGDILRELAMDSYAPFPFLPPVETGRLGSVYEIRTYMLKEGGVPGTIAAWEAAVPERVKHSPLVIAMYALDGRPRFTHIWPYAGLDARAAMRGEMVRQGIWPPKGGPQWLTGEMASTIGLPTSISPLA